jgi:drug/metabolite transporter superfamily protein YnfA
MRRRVPWLTLGILALALIALFEPDLEQGNWGQVALKLGGLILLCGAVWGWNIWRRRRN